MQLEVGKTYRTRGGGLCRIIADKGPNEWYPVVAAYEDGATVAYTREGFLLGSDFPRDADLVEEIPSAQLPPASQAPSADRPLAALVPRVWVLLDDTLENGIALGWNRAHKHDDSPTPERIREAIREACLTAVCEAFHIIEPGDD